MYNTNDPEGQTDDLKVATSSKNVIMSGRYMILIAVGMYYQVYKKNLSMYTAC